MKLEIAIELNNAAFDGCNGQEVARILRRLADDVQESNLEIGDGSGLRDYNGNRVGMAEVIED